MSRGGGAFTIYSLVHTIHEVFTQHNDKYESLQRPLEKSHPFEYIVQL